MEAFLAEHLDTVLVIIDTLQMVRPLHDATYANDYRDLSALKKLADQHGIAILLIHHLRKEKAEDVFQRISGTTALSGAVDTSFVLTEERRGSGQAKLSCIGRDIEFRELLLERDADNIWTLCSDSLECPAPLGEKIVLLLSELLRARGSWIGTPTELSQQIDPEGREGVTPKKVSRLLLQSVEALEKAGITVSVRRSNGRRIVELHSAESADAPEAPGIDPIDPALGSDRRERAPTGGKIPPVREGKHRVRLYAGHSFRGAAPVPQPLKGREE